MKKKLVAVFFILAILVCVTATFTQETKVYALRQRIEVYDGNRGVLSYAVENNEAVFLGYHPYEEGIKEYQIPTYIAGYKVTVIGENAFQDSVFEKIHIPSTVKTMESCAFGGYRSELKELIIPDSVTTIAENTINYAPKLEKVIIGNGVKEIPYIAFAGLESLKTVVLGDGIEVIDESCFSSCQALESITLPKGLKTIEAGAFAECVSLKSITIPDSVTSIGMFAFNRCTSLETAVIGNGVTELPLGTFEGSGLSKVVLGKNVKVIGEQAFMNCSSLKEIKFPNGLKDIKRLSFWGCSSIESIVIPDSVESVGDNAFIECTSLKNLVVGSGVKKLEESAFAWCISLNSVTLKYGLGEIGNNAFSGTESLKSITIPDSVTTIGEHAFNCSGIESVKFGSRVGRIEEGAFSTCPNLKSVEIPDSVTYMGQDAFWYNSSLETVVIGDRLEEIPVNAFSYCDVLESVYFGENVKIVDGAAFQSCHSLETVKLNEGLKIIGNSAFNDCKSLKEITIPNTVTKISEWAFCNCDSLEKVNIGYLVESIDEMAFAYTKNLKELYIPKNVIAFEFNTFEGSGLKEVVYAGTQEQWRKIVCWSSVESIATVHFGKKTDKISTATVKSNSIYRRQAVVYKNLKDMTTSKDEYVICTDARVEFEGKEYAADENGIIPLPESNGDIVVSAPGYRTEYLEYMDYMNGLGVFLEQETTLPIIKSVKLGKDEIRRSSEKFSKVTSAQIKVDYDLNGHEGCEVYIENGDNKWTISSDGYSGTIDIGQQYNSWNSCRVVIKMADGRLIYKWLQTGYAPAAVEKPQVSFGNSFSGLGANTIPYLDTIKFDFSIPNFPFDVTISGDKVVATFGVDVTKWKYSGEKGEWDNKYNAHKSLADVIKNSREQMKTATSAADEYADLLKNLGSAKPKGLKSKFGFGADLSAVGYLEGTIDNKGVYFSDGGIIISLSAEGGLSDQGILMVGPAPVPYNWEAMLKGKIEAQFQLAQREARSEELTPKGSLGGSIGLKVGAGPGISDVHLNFCVQGSLDPLFIYSYNSSEFKLDANVSVFVEATMGPYEHNFYLAKKTFNLYPEAPQTMARTKMFATSPITASEFKVIERNYDENPSYFVANRTARLLTNSNVNETVIKTNTFKVSDPQMADLGSGKRIIAWVDDDMAADALNGRTIMYSYFDGSVWSDERFVDKNGMSAYNPQIKKVGGKVYLAWESVDAVLSKNSTLDDMLGNIEIKYAVFDETTGSFKNITSLTDNTYTDTDPVINDLNGTAVITWVSNSASDIFTANKNNSISFAVVDGASVTKTEIAVEGISSVESHIATGDPRWVEVMYIADTDDDLQTNEDNELFGTYTGQLTDDDNAKLSVQMCDDIVYFYNGGKLTSYSSGKLEDTAITLPHDRFVICEDKTIIYLDRNGAASDAYAYFCDKTDGSYAKPVKLTNLGEYYLEDVSGFKNSEGEIILAFNKRHITGDFEENIGTLYGQSDLSTVIVAPSCDITLGYAYVDANNIVPGYDSIIEADVTNNGTKKINSVNIALYDANGNLIISSDEEIEILPGESATLELVYSVPENFTGLEGKVTVSIHDERNTDDNSYNLSFICTDICVDNLSYAANESGTYTIFAEITNGSFVEENEISVKLMKGDTVVEEKVIDSLGKFESTVLAFENISKGSTYSVVAKQLENETMLGNNDEFITVVSDDDDFSYLIDGLIIKTVDDKITIEADIVAEEEVTQNTLLIVALYDIEGVVVSTKTIPVNFENEKIKPVKDSMDVCEFESAKIMLWNTSLQPLATVIK